MRRVEQEHLVAAEQVPLDDVAILGLQLDVEGRVVHEVVLAA